MGVIKKPTPLSKHTFPNWIHMISQINSHRMGISGHVWHCSTRTFRWSDGQLRNETCLEGAFSHLKKILRGTFHANTAGRHENLETIVNHFSHSLSLSKCTQLACFMELYLLPFLSSFTTLSPILSLPRPLQRKQKSMSDIMSCCSASGPCEIRFFGHTPCFTTWSSTWHLQDPCQ